VSEAHKKGSLVVLFMNTSAIESWAENFSSSMEIRLKVMLFGIINDNNGAGKGPSQNNRWIFCSRYSFE
jgi:hypothetical protein